MAINVKELNASKFSGVFEGSIENAVDSSKLGGETSEQWQSKIDNIQTTSRASLSVAGWYRVAEYKVSDSTIYSIGANSNGCDIVIRKQASNSAGAYYKLSLASTADKHQSFSVIKSVGSTSISKIRYTYTTDATAYIEIYYTDNVANNVGIIITNGEDVYTDVQGWKAITPTLTEETVDGVTVTTTYDIPANASPVTDLDIANFMRDNNDYGYNFFNSHDLNDWVKSGCYASNSLCVNYPANDGYGDVLVITGYPDMRVTQIFRDWGDNKLYYRVLNSGTWESWQTLATTADLANYLPIVNGEALFQKANEAVAYTLDNGIHKGSFMSDRNGNLGIWDDTAKGWLLLSAAEGGKYFYGTATGNLSLTGGTVTIANNMDFHRAHDVVIGVKNTTSGGKTSYISMQADSAANSVYIGNSDGYGYIVDKTSGYILNSSNFDDYALPKNGGGTVSKAGFEPITVKNTNSGEGVALSFENGDGHVGAFGFDGNKKPTYYNAGHVSYYEILHSGNYTDYTIPKDYGTATNFAIGHNVAIGDPAFRFSDRDGNVVAYIGMHNGHVYKWNSDFSAAKLLDEANYTDYTIPKIGGGTVTAAEGSNTALTVKGSTTEGTSWIRFNDKNNTQLGYLGFDSVNNPTFLNADGATGSAILHSRNYYDYALPKTGGGISGNVTIYTEIKDHSSPTDHCLVINSSTVPTGTTLSLGNAPGIGFHIANVAWGSMIYDGSFKFVNSYFNSYVPVYASTFYGSLSGNAATATALTSSAGGSGTPVYFASGKPVACSYNLGANIANHSGSLATGGWKALGGRSSGQRIYVAYNNSPAAWNCGAYSSSLVFGAQDTKGLLDCAYNSPVVSFGGGAVSNSTDDNPNWYFKLAGTNGKTYALPSDSGTLVLTSGSITGSSGSCTGNAATATTASYIKTPYTTGYTTDGYGNFVHQGTGSEDNFNIFNNAKDKSLRYVFETGNLSVTGTMSSTTFIEGGTSLSNKYATVNHTHNYYPYYNYTIDLSDSKYSCDTWYPVIGGHIPYDGYKHIKVAVQLNSGTKPSWSTHASGFTCNLDLLVKAGGWGTTNGGTICLDYYYSFADNNPVGFIQLTNSSTPVLYLRGGGKYYVYTDYSTSWSPVTTTYTVAEQSVDPTTTFPNINYVQSTISAHIYGNATTATTLQTARTIRTNLGSTSSASFNGSDNITPGVTGTLPLTNGGTGATTAAGALTNLGITATATELNYLDGVTGVKNGTASTSTTYGTGDKHLINSAFLSYWNGAYGTSGASNLAYCNRGAFGTIVTKNTSDYAAATHNQAASTITAGTFAGNVAVPASTAYTTNQVRNIVYTTTDPGAGVSTSHANGSLIAVYE